MTSPFPDDMPPPPPPPLVAVPVVEYSSSPPRRAKLTLEDLLHSPLAGGLVADDVDKMMRERRSRSELHRRMCRAFLPTYATEVLRGPPEYGGAFLLGPHHLEWGVAVNDHPRILALAARDHGKSHNWCFAYPLWMVDVRAPGRVGYIFSATEKQACDHLNKIRQELLGGGENGGPNAKLAHLLPLKKDSVNTIVFANGSEIRARSFGAKVRGGHPYWIVCDDVLNDEHIWSEGIRTKSVDYFLSAIEPMVIPGGQLVVVGTPFHSQDLYAHLEEGGVFALLKHPAIMADGRPLWPARYDQKALDLKRRILNSAIRWSREYLCRPMSDEASLFPGYLFDAPGVKLPYRLGLPGSYWQQRGFSTFMGVDLALSASAGADHMVLFVLAVDWETKDRYVVDIIRRKGLGYQAQVDLIIQACGRYCCGLVFVEANQYQRVISDMVIRQSDVPVKAFYTTGRSRKAATTERRGIKGSYAANKNALDQGIPGLRMLMENGKLKMPWDPETREMVKVWIGEMQSFGYAEGKLQGVGSHDDTVLAFWMADRAIAIGENYDLSFDGEGRPGEPADPAIGDPFGDSSGLQPGDPDFFGTGSH